MRQFTQKEFIKILNYNGFFLDRKNGKHLVFVNAENRHISIPTTIRCVIARRLIKENNLNVDIK